MKYTKPLALDEYDRLTLEEKAAYISDMVDRLLREPPTPDRPHPPNDKPKGDPRPNNKPKTR